MGALLAVRGEGVPRTSWNGGTVHGSPEPPARARVERVFPALGFREPVELVHEPGGARWWVLELGGRLLSFPDRPDAAVGAPALVLARPGHPVGQALGFALHPGFATNREVFVVYTMGDGKADGSRLSRFQATRADPPVVDAASETVLLTWRSGGHNGSAVRFGPDGFLYVSTGDGSPPEPPDALHTGQNLDDLLSCILRIDADRPSAGRPYSIPPANPFADRAGARPEIWAYGFRNPWRMAFAPDGALWVGDVGWELWETIHRATAGYNAGWSRLEGPQIVHGELQPPTPIHEPVVSVPHGEFASITGGCFHDGAGLPWLAGAYVYGDFETGKIRALRHESGRMTWGEELCDTTLKIVAFAADPAGGLLVLDHGQGAGIYRLVANTAGVATAGFPRRLSETGVFADVVAGKPSPGVVSFEIAAPRWTDHATARRWLAVPGAGQVTPHTGKESWERRWDFPRDSVLVKTLSLEMKAGRPESRRRIETQMLHNDGEAWQAYSYRWNEAETDADLVPSGGAAAELEVEDPTAPGGIRRQSWRFAARGECLRCHNTWSGPPLGFNFEQLSATSAGDEVARLTREGFIAVGEGRGAVPVLRPPGDESAGLEPRARSWLHANCAPCHRWGAGGAVAAYFNLDRSLADSRILNVAPVRGAFGIPGARLVSPGAPWRSVVNYRLSSEEAGHMPPIGSRLVDDAGVGLVRRWIASLKAGETPPKSTGTPSDTASALAYLEAHPRPPEAVVNAAVVSTNGAVRDLFQRHLPPSRRRAVLGPGFAAAPVLNLSGSAARGRMLFASESGPNCVRCHSAGGRGGVFGPALDGLGRRLGREDLLDQIVQPSKRIAPDFTVHQVETRDGLTRSGFVTKRTAGSVELRQEDGRITVIPAGDIMADSISPVSAMPEGLLDSLTADDAADLLAFLMSLR